MLEKGEIKVKPFTGIWATFMAIENFKDSLADLQEKSDCHVTVHSPFLVTGIESFIKPSRNYLNLYSVAGALLGALVSICLVVQTSLAWIQPLSAKPIVSILTFVPVVFEVTIFSTVFFTLVGIALLTIRNSLATALPKSNKYKTYKRFTRDRFGIVVFCEVGMISELKKIFHNHQAEEIFIEE